MKAQAIKKNKMTITRYWFDIEPTSVNQPNTPCNSWQNSKAENEKLAKEWVALLKKTKLPWGVYANGYGLPLTTPLTIEIAQN